LGQWIPNVKALRDVSVADLEEHKSELPKVVAKRAEHVIFENERVLASREALESRNFEKFGRLMNASHDSARDLYEVSCAELEAMVEVTRSSPGALCGRMAGAGFGGCTVSIVEDRHVERFIDVVKVGYEKKTGLNPALYVCTAADGASIIEGNS
jgi:galactokinase